MREDFKPHILAFGIAIVGEECDIEEGAGEAGGDEHGEGPEGEFSEVGPGAGGGDDAGAEGICAAFGTAVGGHGDEEILATSAAGLIVFGAALPGAVEGPSDNEEDEEDEESFEGVDEWELRRHGGWHCTSARGLGVWNMGARHLG